MASHIPQHTGPNILPNFPLFTKLLGYAARSTSIVIKDVTNDFQATHAQLLTDVLHVRNVLLESLHEETKEQLWRGEEVYMNLLTPAGYEFAVGFLAILAIGAIIVPLCKFHCLQLETRYIDRLVPAPALPVKEATYFVRTSRAVACLTASKCSKLGQDLSAEVSRTFNPRYQLHELGPLVKRPPLAANKIITSRDHLLDYNGSGIVIFTSGTTGPPKGAMRRRSFFDGYAQVFANMFYLGPNDTVMHNLPVHHVTGIGTSFLPYLVAGACVEFHSGGFDVAKVWDRWRKKDLTLFSGVPTIYMRLMQYYEQHISKLPAKERQEYIDGARNMRALMCGTAALPRPLQRKWLNLVPGKRILERYGSTECSSCFTIHPEDNQCPDVSICGITIGRFLTPYRDRWERSSQVLMFGSLKANLARS